MLTPITWKNGAGAVYYEGASYDERVVPPSVRGMTSRDAPPEREQARSRSGHRDHSASAERRNRRREERRHRKRDTLEGAVDPTVLPSEPVLGEMLLGSIQRPSVPAAKRCTPRCRLRSLSAPIRVLLARGEARFLVRQPVTEWLLQSLEPPPFRDLHTATRRTATVKVHYIRTGEIVLFPAHLLRRLAPFSHRGLHQVSRTLR